MLGRLIGLIYFVPFVVFWALCRIPEAFSAKITHWPRAGRVAGVNGLVYGQEWFG